MMDDRLSFRAVVKGRVQGVFYRGFVESHARRLGLEGYVRNQRDGSVEVVAEGNKESLDKLMVLLRQGPPAARVDDIDISWGDASGDYPGFYVR
jgi:acylphosphatase